VGPILDRVPQSPERVARNQAVFREVNDRIHEVSAHWQTEDAVSFVCECSRADCVEALTLTLEEYEAIRAEPTWFVVAPGHVNRERGRLVRTEGARYAVVEEVPESALSVGNQA
jgi:hypothetical protein